MSLLFLSLYLILVVLVMAVVIYKLTVKNQELGMSLWKEKSLNQALMLQNRIYQERLENK